MSNETYKQKIERIKSQLTTNKSSITGIINNYKNNINDINTKIDSINSKNWIDDVEVEYSDYIDYLKTGIILKLNNSIDSVDGSMTTFKKLIDDLEEKCNDYLNAITNAESTYWSITFDENNNSFKQGEIIASESYHEDKTADNEEDLSNLNLQFNNLVTSIDDILNQLKELRFESVNAYESTKDYDFSVLKKEETKKKKKKEQAKEDDGYKLPTVKGQEFESPDDAWILIKDNMKTYMERDSDPVTGRTTSDAGEHVVWAYNKVSGELVQIDDYDFHMGFIESSYSFTLPNGKTITTYDMEPAYNGVASHISKYLPETVQDKWILRHVDASIENNKEVYEQLHKDTELPDTFVMPDKFYFHNLVTNEEVELSNVKMKDEGDKYIIEQDGQTYIVYKDNYVEWDLNDSKYYNDTKNTPVIRAAD